MNAELSRLLAIALQSPLFRSASLQQENLSDTTISECIGQTVKTLPPDKAKFLRDCANSLDWAARNREFNWKYDPESLSRVVTGFSTNPYQSPNLPISNRDRFPDANWGPVRQIGSIGTERLIWLGREEGTDADLVSRDDGIQADYHAAYLHEFLQAQDPIEIDEMSYEQIKIPA
ncbi:MAG TPA: hypothetical protein V6D19_06650 [Stenomitos sp.]